MAGPEIRSERVVVAAGGLGTRVHGWSRYLPKEWLPVDGRPGIVHLLEEIAGLGSAHAVIVYHPYYEPFVAWARQVLAARGHHRYLRSAGRTPPDADPLAGVRVDWVAQDGAYGDLTSLLNGADHLARPAHCGGDLYVAYSDNLYPASNALAALRQAPPGVAVLARAYQAELAQHRGVIVTTPGQDGAARMAELWEKPGPDALRALEERHGTGNLMLVEGRARVDDDLLEYARTPPSAPDGEPGLSLVLATYCRQRPVYVVSTTSEVVDLGTPTASS